ncbi:hypothetical protein, partial [Salininema proteolyticum]
MRRTDIDNHLGYVSHADPVKDRENGSDTLNELLRSGKVKRSLLDLVVACCLRTEQGVWMVSVRAIGFAGGFRV